MSPTSTILILLGYFAVLVLLSLWASRSSDKQSFYTGNRQSPWYLVAIGMIGASLSGVTFLSVPGWVASTHFGYMQTVFGYMIGYMVIALVLLPLYYRMNLTSIYTYLEHRFGEYSYKTGAAYFILSRIIGASFRLFLVAGVLHMAIFEPFGLPYWVTVAVTILLIFTYTFSSGIKTVVYTDVLQTLFLVGAVILTIVFISNEMGWSFGEMVSNLRSDPNTQIFHFETQSNNAFWKQFLGGAFIAMVMTGLDQDMMQKNLSISGVKKAQRNIYTQMVLFVIVNIIFLSLGALLFQYAAAEGISVEKTDQLFQTIALDHAKPLISIFFVLGVVAAAYSSADSALTALTTSFCVDFLGFERIKETHVGTRRLVHAGFAVILFITILIFNQMNNGAVINELFQAAGFTYGPLLGMFAFGILTKRVYPDFAIIPVSLFSIGCTALYYWGMPHVVEGFKPGFELIILNGGICFGVLAAISKKRLESDAIA
ncbi:sodium:solute symporter [bacterium]|nr:sodium:solute symporter [bacterium]